MPEKTSPTLLKSIAILTTIGFAVLYFFGYLFLRLYFKSIGGLIPINDLPAPEIAILGISPLFLFLSLLTGVCYLDWLLSKNRKDRKVSVQFYIERPFQFIKNSFLSLLILYFSLSFFSTYLFTNGLPYSFPISLKKQLPIIEMIYGSPLINSSQTRDLKLYKEYEGNLFYEALKKFRDEGTEPNIDQLLETETEFVNPEITFTDQLGEKRFINTFRLYFESKDNYYLQPPTSFCEVNDKGDTPFTFDGKTVYPFDRDICELIIMPKTHVESIKYLTNSVEGYPRISGAMPIESYPYGPKALLRMERMQKIRQNEVDAKSN